MTAADIQRDAASEAVALCALLTDRERDVLILSAKGLIAQEIGDCMHRSHRTIERYRDAVLRKLGVGSIIEAAVIAAKAGIV